MVVKSQLLFIIAVISGFLLTIQLITLQLIVNRSKPDSNPIWRSLYAITTAASSADVSLFLIDPFLLQNISNRNEYKRLFGRHDGQQQSKIFPSMTSGFNYCKILCHGQKVTRLAALAEFTNEYKIIKLKSNLAGRGYTIIEVTDQSTQSSSHTKQDVKVSSHPHYLYQSASKAINAPTPTLSSLSSVKLWHLLILDEKVSPNDGHVVIISLLYEKMRDNWFRGRLDLTPDQERVLYRQGVRKSHFYRWTDISTLIPKTEVDAMIMDGLLIDMPRSVHNFINPLEELDFLECNRSRARGFHQMFPYSEKDLELNRLFRLKARRMISSAKTILDSLNLPFWISSGTLLGHYRQCDVIHYGMDVDIGIFIDSLTPEDPERIIDAFFMNDLPMMHLFGMLNDSFEMSFRDEYIKLDMFFFYREKDHYWNGGTNTKTGFKYKYSFLPFGLCWTDFLGLKVRIPCPTLPYIQANYGSDWFTPKREWDWKTSPPNVSPNGQWPLELWPQVIQSFNLPHL
jgi:hypothetical protein